MRGHENTMLSAYEMIYDQLFIRALSIVRDKELALDVLQDVALMLVERGRAFDGIRFKKAFLQTCVRNRAIDVMRKNKRSIAVDAETMALLFKKGDGLSDFARIENEQWLRACLTSLAPVMREAFIQHVLDGAKIRDIAAIIGMPANSLAKNFRSIKRRIAHTTGKRDYTNPH